MLGTLSRAKRANMCGPALPMRIRKRGAHFPEARRLGAGLNQPSGDEAFGANGIEHGMLEHRTTRILHSSASRKLTPTTGHVAPRSSNSPATRGERAHRGLFPSPPLAGESWRGGVTRSLGYRHLGSPGSIMLARQLDVVIGADEIVDRLAADVFGIIGREDLASCARSPARRCRAGPPRSIPWGSCGCRARDRHIPSASGVSVWSWPR